jgi:hypothetical protein
MLSTLLLLLGCLFVCVALRSSGHSLLFRLGNLGILGTSYLVGWKLTGYRSVGGLLASTWLLFPWIDIVTRVRNLQMPADRPLHPQAPPGPSRFPMLSEITEELEAEGFESIDDAGWDHEDQRQFVRLFIHPNLRLRATLNLVESPELSFYYLTVSSRTSEGGLWLTWNYPFSSSLKPSPNWKIQRLRGACTVPALLDAHQDWLDRLGAPALMPVENDPDKLRAEIERELHSQVEHNVACGVLLHGEPGLVRYSWWGCFYLWAQFLRDLLRA